MVGSKYDGRRNDLNSIYVNEPEGERFWDLYIWKSFENYGPNQPPVLTTLTGKRYLDGTLDLKIVFTYMPSKEQSVWDWLKLPYHEYVNVKAATVTEFGFEGLEKVVVEGKPVFLSDP